MNYVVTSYQRLTQTLNQLQGCLAAGFPFVFGFSVFDGWYFQDPHPTIIPLPSQSDNVVGGHAVMCVGYDNSKRLFRIRNSWGSGAGDDGYFYMPYAYLTSANLSSDFWVINAVKD
jgi:C1A family cysteine protease